MPRIVYCHGFSSSPSGRKATALRALLEPEGLEFVAPDLNAPSFERLSWTAMVEVAVTAMDAAPTDVIVGTSLGGLLALEVSRLRPAPLVLVVPTLGFGPRWTLPLPDGDPVRFIDRVTGEERVLHRAFVEVFLERPDELAPPPHPVTVIAGRQDTAIPFGQVREVFDRWVASGALPQRSELIDLPDADHSMRGFDDVVADAVRRRLRPVLSFKGT